MNYMTSDLIQSFKVEENVINLKYIIQESNYNGNILYGFKIEKYLNNQFSESECFENITDSYKIAQIILKKLYEGLVTPVTLCYVIDDIIGEIENADIKY